MKDGNSTYHISTPSAQDVLDFLRQNPEAVAEALKHEHRTHQQSVAGGILKVLKSLSEHGTDMRNDAAVRWAKQAIELAPYGFPFL